MNGDDAYSGIADPWFFLYLSGQYHSQIISSIEMNRDAIYSSVVDYWLGPYFCDQSDSQIMCPAESKGNYPKIEPSQRIPETFIEGQHYCFHMNFSSEAEWIKKQNKDYTADYVVQPDSHFSCGDLYTIMFYNVIYNRSHAECLLSDDCAINKDNQEQNRGYIDQARDYVIQTVLNYRYVAVSIVFSLFVERELNKQLGGCSKTGAGAALVKIGSKLAGIMMANSIYNILRYGSSSDYITPLPPEALIYTTLNEGSKIFLPPLLMIDKRNIVPMLALKITSTCVAGFLPDMTIGSGKEPNIKQVFKRGTYVFLDESLKLGAKQYLPIHGFLAHSLIAITNKLVAKGAVGLILD